MVCDRRNAYACWEIISWVFAKGQNTLLLITLWGIIGAGKRLAHLAVLNVGSD